MCLVASSSDRHTSLQALYSGRDLLSNPNHAAGASSTFVNVWTHSSMVVCRRIDVGYPHRLPAKGTTLSGLKSAMMDISRLLD